MATAWHRHRFDYPQRIPTMISKEECRYLHWLGSNVWTGRGHIVEMGPWLGGSTVCLAAGMKASACESDHKLHTFDSFVWADFMSRFSPLPLAAGESFEPNFRENIEPWSDRIEVHRARLPDEAMEHDHLAAVTRTGVESSLPVVTWDRNEPVEILFVDGAKSWTGMRKLLRTFCGSLDTGSLLVLQDYKYWGAYWVAVTIEFLSDHVELVHNLESSTVTFRLTRPIGEDVVDRLPEWDQLEAQDCVGLLDRAAARLHADGDPDGELVLELCKARMWAHKREPDAALRQFQRVEEMWPLLRPDGNLRMARRWFRGETNMALRPTRKSQVRNAWLTIKKIVGDGERHQRR